METPLATHVLVTAFEPFGDFPENTSEWVLRELQARIRPGMGMQLMRLPVLYDEAAVRILDRMMEHTFDEIVMLGMADSHPTVRIETRAHNRDSSPLADNDGIVRVDLIISSSGQSEITTYYPREQLRKFLSSKGVSCELSDSAGSFVCNNTYFRLASAMMEGGDPFDSPACTFIHVPGPTGWQRSDAARFAEVMLEWFRVSRGG